MAVPAPKGQTRDHKGRFDGNLVLPVADRKEAAARLYGLGFHRTQIARAMVQILSPSGNLKQARQRLREWEQEKEFRDLIWKHAVVKLDLETPQILEGVAKAAKRGRVDAAKLALGVAERYTDKSDQPQEVHIELKGLGRPNDRELNGPVEEKKALPRPTSTTEVDQDDLDY